MYRRANLQPVHWAVKGALCAKSEAVPRFYAALLWNSGFVNEFLRFLLQAAYCIAW